MKILTNTWHYELYCKAAEAWFGFLDRKHDSNYWGPSRFGREKWFNASNICFYVRVITVWAPTMLLLRLSPLLALWLTFYALPKAFFGLVAFYIGFGIVLGLIVMAAAAVFSLAWLFTDDPLGILRAVGKPLGAIGSFLAVLGIWLWSKKKKICPTIEFVTPGGNDV